LPLGEPLGLSTIEELIYSVEYGGFEAACNSIIVVSVLKKEMAALRDRIRSLITEMPVATGRPDRLASCS